MPQSVVSLPVHLVFSTKNRAALIGDDMQSRLHEYIGGILREQKSKLVAAGGMPDHIHLLVLLSKQVALADRLRDTKSASSK
jgi:putative transposase